MKRLSIIRSGKRIEELFPDLRDFSRGFPKSRMTITPEGGVLILRGAYPAPEEGGEMISLLTLAIALRDASDQYVRLAALIRH